MKKSLKNTIILLFALALLALPSLALTLTNQTLQTSTTNYSVFVNETITPEWLLVNSSDIEFYNISSLINRIDNTGLVVSVVSFHNMSNDVLYNMSGDDILNVSASDSQFIGLGINETLYVLDSYYINISDSFGTELWVETTQVDPSVTTLSITSVSSLIKNVINTGSDTVNATVIFNTSQPCDTLTKASLTSVTGFYNTEWQASDICSSGLITLQVRGVERGTNTITLTTTSTPVVESHGGGGAGGGGCLDGYFRNSTGDCDLIINISELANVTIQEKILELGPSLEKAKKYLDITQYRWLFVLASLGVFLASIDYRKKKLRFTWIFGIALLIYAFNDYLIPYFTNITTLYFSPAEAWLASKNLVETSRIILALTSILFVVFSVDFKKKTLKWTFGFALLALFFAFYDFIFKKAQGHILLLGIAAIITLMAFMFFYKNGSRKY